MDNVDYLSVAIDIAREVGPLLLQHYEQRVAVEYKGEFNLVTTADRAAESLIVERLRKDHAIYMVGDSRINVAGLNAQTVPVLARAIIEAGG